MRSLLSLNRVILAQVDTKLGQGDTGQLLSPATAGRFRKVARACVRRAVELEIIPKDPWPPTPKGRSQRKAMKARRAVDIRALPGPAMMRRALEAITSHQPGSNTYRVMTAVVYYAGLRPSEVVMLRPRALALPASGWGRIDVVEATSRGMNRASPRLEHEASDPANTRPDAE
jgi:integrase